jgi:hypothetical protein
MCKSNKLQSADSLAQIEYLIFENSSLFAEEKFTKAQTIYKYALTICRGGFDALHLLDMLLLQTKSFAEK